MSTIVAVPPVERAPESASAPPATTRAVEFHYTQTESFAALLHQLGASLLVSTYQANKLLAMRAIGNGLSTLVRTFDRPMGLAVNGERFALGCREQVWQFRNAPAIAPLIEPAGQNGLAVVRGQPKYVTALGETDTLNGWRANKAHGGCLMEVSSGERISRGLSMPHSPRWHDGRLWLLESGSGQLIFVDPNTGCQETITELPGFARGLAFCQQYAFIGLSKIRATSTMAGVPLADRRDELKCGVAVVDLTSGRICAMLEFHTAVEETFDVHLLGGVRFPEVMGFQQDTIHHTFTLPAEEPLLANVYP